MIDLTAIKCSFWRYMDAIRQPYQTGVVAHPIYLFEFAGAIGAGKTATADATVELMHQCGLDKKFRIFHINEDIQSNDNKKAIDDFYNEKSESSDADLENTICGKRIQNLIDVLNVAGSTENELPAIIISDRSVEEDVKFICNLIEKNGDCGVSDKLYAIKQNIYTFLRNINDFESRVIHKVLYLWPGLEEALNRIRRRGRPNEQQINYDTLSKLTTFPEDFSYGVIFDINNSELDIEEAALMSYERIIWEIAAPLDNDESENKVPLHKVLVSFYGVPGSGKSYFLKELHAKLSVFSFEEGCYPDFCATVFDQSDGPHIEEEQRKIYENEDLAMTADDMQDWIDDRRIAAFDELEGDHFSAFIFTDVGPLTSVIFRRVTGCINVDEDNEYAKWFSCGNSHRYDIHINVVVEPSGDLDEVRQHIKERGRPGEYEYFTVEKLEEIDGEIEQFVKNPLVVSNDYSQSSVEEMFHKVMGAIRNAVIGYSTSR